jgi:anti-sigma regulatory factor (Ser/Thr protein kinase)
MTQARAQRSFPRTTRALEAIFAFVAEFVTTARMDASQAFDLEFIVEEIFVNMVKHNAGGTQDIVVELERFGDRVRIRLIDAGVERFDVTRAPEVDTRLPLAERPVGGLGLHLVRKLAESIAYEYDAGSSIVTIVTRVGS